MKTKRKIFCILAKVVLAVAFLQYSGTFEFLSNISLPVSDTNDWTVEKERDASKYIQGKIDSAKQQGNYNVEDYFNDLYDFHTKYGTKASTIRIHELMALSMQNSDDAQIVKARDRYQERIDPGREGRKEFQENTSKLGWGGVAAWLFSTYLYFLPWIFGLFLIWVYETSRKKFFLANPLSFLLGTAFYPLTLGYLIFRRIRGEVEIRRSKERVFSFLSEDELRAVGEFVKTRISLHELRKSAFGKKRTTYRHAFATALCATVILLFIPQTLMMHSLYIPQLSVSFVESGITDTGPPGDAFGVEDSGMPARWFWEEFDDDKIVCNLPETSLERCRSGYLQGIEHVPVLNWLTSTLTNQFKKLIGTKNEKHNNMFRRCSFAY
jgi:hypothetical protein